MPGSVEIGPVNVGVSIGSVNEGPVRGSLEGFRPMNTSDISTIDKGGTIAPLGEIVFNVAKPLPKQDGEGLGAPVWKEPEPAVASPGVLPQAEQIAAEVWNRTEPAAHLQPEVRTVVRQEEAIYAPAVEQQVVEEIIQPEQTKVQDRIEELSEAREEEETEESRIKYVEDEPVSKQRRYELREAIKKAGAEVKEEGVDAVEGWRIKKYFVPEHAGNRSGIAEAGIADGSLVETYQDISAKNYGSESEANEVVDSTVEEKKAVTKAKEGKRVRGIDVARVLRESFVKNHPVEEVVSRVVKKRIWVEKLGQKVVFQEVKPETGEPTLEEIHPDLSEIFALQKAA